jgi:nicotinate-nucleotide pyrophosphorylase (carboxylating)
VPYRQRRHRVKHSARCAKTFLVNQAYIETIVQRALEEDLPDITSAAIFDPEESGRAHFLVKEEGVLAGLTVAEAVFRAIDGGSRFRALKRDGDRVSVGDVVAEVEARVVALLAGERTALNFLQRASGIATMTRRFVDAVAGTEARIYDTRKTVPGLRLFDKYAVVAGGGENYRIGLFDMVLIKNNHIDRSGSITAAVERVRSRPESHAVMVEVRNLPELEEALGLHPDFILLDNMDTATMRAAVVRTGGAIPLEASGGVTLENVRAIAETGVDRISVGALTHSVAALDVSMRVDATR